MATRTHPRQRTVPEARPGTTSSSAWRRWSTRHRVLAALLSGLVATHIATVLGFWMGGFGLVRLDWNTANGKVYAPKESALSQFLIGGGMHYVDGIVFAVLFAVAIHPRLPWPNTEGGNILKGLAFGTILAVIALAVLTPLIYGPARGADAGVFSSGFGWKYIVGVFLFHWIYGANVGLIYSPLEDHDAVAADTA